MIPGRSETGMMRGKLEPLAIVCHARFLRPLAAGANAKNALVATNCPKQATFRARQEETMPEPKKHAENRGWIESVLRRIPGFRGYLEKEYRRESDDLQRDWLADRLQRSKRGLDAFARQLADAGQIDDLPQLDRLRAKLDRVIGRIRGAMQGYSGFFDLVQIDEAALDRIYEHDLALMEQVAKLADEIEKLGSEGAGATRGWRSLAAALRTN
jgi:hypothetical protein